MLYYQVVTRSKKIKNIKLKNKQQNICFNTKMISIDQIV